MAMKTIRVDLGDSSYPIFIEPQLIENVTPHIRTHTPTGQAVIISDHTVSSHYGEKVRNELTYEGMQTELLSVPDGEDSKSWESMGNLLTRCIQNGLRRDGLIIALGGGVIGDLAGFVASTYLRGIRLVQIPTSLLAQVDSSVGGKVGINHPLGKNLIGNFYQPQLVLIDPMTLRTLDKRELGAGMGEVIKYGLIWSEPFFTRLESNFDLLTGLKDMARVTEMLAFCCRVKADVVEKDEKENGIRRILNFGHTIGHALEAVTDFHTFKHGEAVIHGMHWAAWVSWKENLIPERSFIRIESLLSRIPVPALPADLTPESLIDKIRIDKKQTGKGLFIILLESIGKTVIRQTNDISSAIAGWLAYMQSRETARN
jgi:3-dehydroquinate synthase